MRNHLIAYFLILLVTSSHFTSAVRHGRSHQFTLDAPNNSLLAGAAKQQKIFREGPLYRYLIEKSFSTDNKFAESASAVKDAVESFEMMVSAVDTKDMQEIAQFAGKLKSLAGAFAFLGVASVALNIIFPEKDRFDEVLDKMETMQGVIVDTINEQFDQTNEANQKMLYVEAERHIHAATVYLNKIQEARKLDTSTGKVVVTDQNAYNFYKLAFKERMEATGFDDFEAVLSIYTPTSAFLKKSYFQVVIDSSNGLDKEYADNIGAILSLTMLAYTNLQAYLALIDIDGSQGLKFGLAQYFEEVMTEADSNLAKLKGSVSTVAISKIKKAIQTQTDKCGNSGSYTDIRKCTAAVFYYLNDIYENSYRITITCYNPQNYPYFGNTLGDNYFSKYQRSDIGCAVWFAKWSCEGQWANAGEFLGKLKRIPRGGGIIDDYVPTAANLNTFSFSIRNDVEAHATLSSFDKMIYTSSYDCAGGFCAGAGWTWKVQSSDKC